MGKEMRERSGSAASRKRGGIRRLRKETRTIILVERNSHQALKAAHHVNLERGERVIAPATWGCADPERLPDLYFARDIAHERIADR